MASRENAAQSAAYWPGPLLRATPAALLAIVITFSADHSVGFGFVVFGSFAMITAVLTLALGVRRTALDPERSTFRVQAIITLAAGAMALVWPGAGLGFLLFLLASWAATTGLLEIYAGLRARGPVAVSRDWIFVGCLTALLAVVLLVLPPDYAQHFTGPDRVDRVLNSSIVAVGLLGAYAAIITVYLVIAALSLKWTTAAAAQDGSAS